VAFHLAQYAEQKKEKDGPLLAGIIVENTFLSISKMVNSLLPWVAPFKFLILRMYWDSEKIAPKISLPILYLSGDKDEVVPFSHMKSLYEISGKASIYSKMHIIRGGMHNDSWSKGGNEYFDQFRLFMSHVISDNFKKGLRPGSSTDLEEICKETTVAVGMGEAEKAVGMNAIPSMPTTLAGLAKEATTSRTDVYKGDKKIK